uniref:transcriptional repressor n=1 Tax=Anaerosporobacter sp. TaxID=1872529 RepID=UPI003FA4903D
MTFILTLDDFSAKMKMVFNYLSGGDAVKRKTIYTTKQGEAVLEYIASLDGVHATVEQIAEYFENQNAGIGLTTIYRNLDKLVK